LSIWQAGGEQSAVDLIVFMTGIAVKTYAAPCKGSKGDIIRAALFIIFIIMVITVVIITGVTVIIIRIIPITLVVALRALFIAVFTRPITSMTGDAICLSGMIEGGIVPIRGIVTL
jgi:hypothetical protein